MTLAEWIPAKTTASNLRLQELLGKLTVRYTKARVFTDFEGDKTVCPYSVVVVEPDAVVIRCRTGGRDEIRRINFAQPDVYWVDMGSNREYFRRLLAC